MLRRGFGSGLENGFRLNPRDCIKTSAITLKTGYNKSNSMTEYSGSGEAERLLPVPVKNAEGVDNGACVTEDSGD